MTFQPTLSFDPMCPNDELDIEIIFTVIPSPDYIVNATVTASLSDLTITDVTFSTDPTNVVVFWATGGGVGNTYVITAEVTTANGRVYNRSVNLPIQAVVY